MKITKKLEAELKQIIETYWDSYARGDLQTWASFLPDNYRNIGTTQEEIWNSKEEIVNYTKAVIDQMVGNFEFRRAQFQIIPFDPNIMIHEFGDIYIRMEDDWAFYSKIRMSSLLQKTKTGWKIIHQHGSYPDWKTDEGETFAFEKISKENLELRDAIKRRTIELENKNRELEIEASLEKVRTIAMGMRKPDDMLDVCRIISDQLQSLGVNEIRNVQTAVFYETKKTYINFEYYTKHNKSLITEVDYRTHELQELFASKMIKGVEELFSETLKSKEVKDWYAYQKTTNQFADSFLETAESLSYYWYSLGPVALGMSTYVPLNEQEINLFKRFRNVFELAYRRFLDIQQAEAQAKEAKIEAALEKVRAVAMSMNKPDDLLNICEVMFKELQSLRFNRLRNTLISTYQDDKDYFNEYDYSDAIGGYITKIPYSSHPALERFQKQIWRTTDAFAEFIIGEDQLSDWKEHRRSNGEPNDPRLENISALYYYFYSIGPASIGISTFNSISEEMREVLKRFRNVFSLSYQRYSDIAQAEAQAREAQIELGLERVRARAMAMHKSEELSELVDTVFKELTKLDFTLKWCIINIIDESTMSNTVWAANPDINKTPESYHMLFEDYPFHNAMMKGYKERAAKYIYVLEGIEKKVYDEYLFNETEFRKVPAAAQAASRAMEKYVVTFSFSNFGGLQTVGEVPLSDTNIDILSRFGKVFDLTYTRFNDLKKAEAQAREAKIEAALERVRSRTMGMQKSEELKDVIRVVYEQFVHLKINVDHAGFVVDYIPKGDWHFWIADEQDIPSKITHPYFESVWANQFNEAKEKGAEFFATNLNFEEKNKFYNELLSYVPGLPEASKDFYLRCPGLAATTVLFDNVSLYIENFSGTPYSDEENKILMRFGKVFQQTYTRFLDLQKAEAQAREAQIELALERVRARTMAMHNSEELSDTAHVLFQQFKEIDKEPKMLTIGIMNETEGLIEFWVTDWSGGGSKVNQKFNASIDEPILLNKIYKAWKEKQKSIVIELSNEELLDWIKYRISLSGILDSTDYSNGRGFVAASFFSKGILSISTYEPFSQETILLLERFAGVFNLTYTRFLDLQKAEAQTREAQIEASLERVRAVAMSMNKSEDLLNICKVSFNEFQKLGFGNIRNAIIHVPNDEKRFFMDYDYSELMGSSITKIDYGSHPIVDDYLKQIRSAEDAFCKVVIKEDQLNDWKNFRKKSGQYDDPRLDEATALYYYMYSIGIGDIGISTFKPIDESQLNILKRFRNVFDLAYRRYNDIALAEEQARETQIQLALERVRARTMAMHKSDDLAEVVAHLFDQLDSLDIKTYRCNLGIVEESSDHIQYWATTNEGKVRPVAASIPISLNIHTNKMYEGWKNQRSIVVIKLLGEERLEWTESVSKHISFTEYQPENIDKEKILNEPAILSNFYFKQGFFAIHTLEELDNSSQNIISRFAKVFEQTYTRFQDLKKAETQAREAKIETSLERVRSKAMAMHSPNDLSETVNVFFKELKTLGIIPIRCGVGQVDEATRTTRLTTTTSSQQGESFQVIGKIKQTGHPVLDGIFDHWKLQKEYHPVLQGEDIKAYYNVMNAQIGYPEYSEGVTQYGNCFFFKEGFVFAWTESLLSEEELIIFRRFTSVLSLTYRRYMDLKEAEEQAKEAKIEASLEKVRSKTMAMQSSDELADTAAVVFQQLINLGIEPNRIYITIIKDETGVCEFWITDEDGSKVSSGFKANLNENDSFKKMYGGWKENKKSITIDMQGEELKEYFRHLSKLNVPFKGGLSQKRRIQYIAYFSKGFIGVASPDETKMETLQLLERFAAVFNLTYTRFNDLKQAEAQNKIIQAENDRKTKELEEARQLQLSLLPKTVPKLPHLDIAVYMKTATEVGGDYYDFNIQKNGVLNIGFGDATGHGLQAGTMITLMKGFFTSDVSRFSPQKFLEHCNGMIRDIKLGRILMSFSHLRFENGSLLISSAGMPPVYYHHKKNNRTEEIIIQGLPLGAMGSASYKLVEKQLNSGDTILLLTDGLPEQMNNHKVIFDYSRVLKYFDEIAENAPKDIINRLVQKAEDWMDGKVQDDDITFIAIKVR